ncbi:L-2-hydroxyglutarate oxidase [Oleiharenicola sp. Vm1]|uniref:L-2-hydroxyglutarate oxidase n=1 Tax=Oleiharenicola sp. Vm1 TaxID=3398393 RepID=UPI0039F4A39E
MKIGIIGGGLVGLGTALALTRRDPRHEVVVLEKESGPGRHQSGHNSGVLHAGLYYKPGSMKARLAVDGIRQMARFCVEQGVPHERCGKLVVAVDESEVPRLRDLEKRGIANGLSGLRWLGAAEIREREPHVAGVAALLVPEEGIVDFPAVAAAMARVLESRGGRLRCDSKVLGWAAREDGHTLETRSGNWSFDFVINCAGLHCDRVARLAGQRPTTRIVPFRGEYFVLRPAAAALVRHLVYPVPNPTFPFLGVHFTRLIHGGIEAGPNAVLAMHREGYRKTDFSARDLAESLAFPGLWRFLARYPRASWQELATSLSRERFLGCLQRLVPDLSADDLRPGGAGVRAQAMTPAGDLVQDFDFVAGARQLHVLNAPSPGATAALAIGEHIAERVAAA